MRLFIPSLSVLLAIGCGCPGSASRERTEDMVRRIGARQLVADATWILRRGARRDGERPIEIPREEWAESIRRLGPLRVYNHRFNLVVVLDASPDTERGIYIGAVQSSYTPRDGDDGFRFESVESGIYTFERER